MYLDKKDMEILGYLENDSSISTQRISELTKIPITTIHNRIKKMKQNGVIKKFTIQKNHSKLGKPISVYILVGITYYQDNGEKTNQYELAKKIKELEGVESVSIVTGTTDIIVHVRTSSIDQLNDFIINKLRSIDGVDDTETLIVLKEV